MKSNGLPVLDRFEYKILLIRFSACGIYNGFYLFICGLFYDSVSISGHVEWQDN
jgi:hypothetical protein